MNPRLTPRAVFCVIAATAIGISVLHILAVGLIVVPAGDDYCNLVATRAAGFGDYIRDFYTGYNGRFASGLVTGIVYNFGMTGFMLVSPLALVALFMTLSYALAPLSRILFADFPGRSFLIAASLLIGLFVVGLVSYHTPYEYLHWLPGTISYTLPVTLVAVMWRFALTSQLAARSPRWAATIVFAASAFLASFHEFVGVFNAGLACTFFIAEYALARPWRRSLSRGAAVIVGSCIGLLTIYFSPGIQVRRDRLFAILKRNIPLREAAEKGAQDLATFLQAFQSWPGIFALAVGIAMGIVVCAALRPRWRETLRTRYVTLQVAAITTGVLMFAVVLWCVATVSERYYNGVAPDRMLIYPYVVLVVTLGSAGACFAAQLWPLLERRQLPGYALIGLMVCGVSVGLWEPTSDYWQRVEGRRAAYQRAVSRVDEARINGVLRISGAWHIMGLGEAAPFSSHWVNRCQAEYFGVPRVIAE